MNYYELLKEVQKHNHLYYDLSKTEISDSDYDILYEKLESIEKAQGWRDPNSPTMRVGGVAGKVKHEIKLYSLNKVYDAKEVDSNFDVDTPKIDGTNLTITYVAGNLVLGLKRGDGEMADDINHLLPYITSLPQTIITTSSKKVIITGECVTDNEVENFRNYVSGALGLKDAEEFKSRNIRFIAHDWLGTDINYTVRMNILAASGFKTVLDKEFCSKYPQDGIVYRINDQKECMRLGYTSKSPRFAVALKERESLTAITVLQRVEWEVGRTGTVNPVGILDPVVVDDATINRVTLHNYEFIENHKLGLGDKVEIERAGGVIPKLIRVIESSNHNKISIADAERAIGGEVVRKGPILYVVDQAAHGTVKLLQHFIKTIGIKGLGPQSITKMGISHPVDLYKNQNWECLGVNGEKIINEIERSKLKPYRVVLAALGIEGVGKTASLKIVKVIPSFSRLKTDIEYVNIPTIGPKTIDKIVTWLAVNSDWVEELPLQLEEVITSEQIEATDDIKKVCITGKVDMTKNQLAEHIEAYGYEVVDSLTKDCYALIYDKAGSTKYNKAEKYGIKLVDYWKNRKLILNGEI